MLVIKKCLVCDNCDQSSFSVKEENETCTYCCDHCGNTLVDTVIIDNDEKII